MAALPYPGPVVPGNASPTYGQTSALMVYETVLYRPASPMTAKRLGSGIIRVGDKITVANRTYTIVGPMDDHPGKR